MLAVFAALLAQAATLTLDVITQPDWVRKPTGEDVAQYYPQAAQGAGLSGRAVLACKVDAAGDLVDCRSEDETPASAGFGDAALKMAHLFRMKPMALNGKPVGGGTVRIPIVFVLPDKGFDPLSGSLLCYGRAANLAELDPSSADKWLATRFWAVQSMAAAAQAHLPPSNIERDLESAHDAAAHQAESDWTRSLDRSCESGMKSALKKQG